MKFKLIYSKKGISVDGKGTGDFTVLYFEGRSTTRLHEGEGNQELETHQ